MRARVRVTWPIPCYNRRVIMPTLALAPRRPSTHVPETSLFCEGTTVKTFLSCAIVFVVLSVCAVPATAESSPQGNRVIQYSAVRTASTPGYYFSGALIQMGVKLRAGDVKKDTFSAKARVT